MSDFFSRLAARALGPEPAVRPRLPGLFEPTGLAVPALVEPASGRTEEESPSLEPAVERHEVVRRVGAPPPPPLLGSVAPALPASPAPEERRSLPPPVRTDAVTAVSPPSGPVSSLPWGDVEPPALPPRLPSAETPGPVAPPPAPALPVGAPPEVRIRELVSPGVAGPSAPPAMVPASPGAERRVVERRVVERRVEPGDAPAVGGKPAPDPPAPPVAAPRVVRREAPGEVPVTPSPAPPSPSPAVRVTIGRLEVRAAPPPPARPARRAASSVMSLEDYLKRHAGGTR